MVKDDLIKNGEFDKVANEINSVKKECLNKIVKVIIETCYLTKDEKIKLCRVVTETGAEFIKTSTGFGTAGADLEDIKLFKENIGGAVRIKAAGGIRDLDTLKAFIDAGCDRVGCSSTMDIVTEMTNLIDAQRGYEANATAFSASKFLMTQGLSIAQS